jgi:hypothetical protein
MRRTNHLHSLLIVGLITFSCLIAWPQTAKAGFIETVEDILNAVHTIDPATDLPSGSDVEGARNLLDCIGGGTDVGICLGNYSGNLDNYHLQKVIDLYVAVKNDDFWGVIGVIGEEAICIVADIMTAGLGGSLCGLIEDIVKGVVEVAEAIAQFFADVGQAFADMAKAIYCFFAGCDGDSGPPPPPPQQVVYEHVFAPKLADGLAAIEKANSINHFNEFYTLVQNLSNGAYNDVAGCLVARGISFQQPDVYQIIYQASEQYRKQVRANWSADIVQRLLPLLGAKRTQYDNPQNISNIEAQIMDWVAQASNIVHGGGQAFMPAVFPLSDVYNGTCRGNFREFEHIDLWISNHQTEANTLHLIMNKAWCDQSYVNHQNQLVNFIKSINPQKCSWDGQRYHCDPIEAYAVCLVLEGLVGLQDLCDIKAPANCPWDGQRYYCASLKDYSACVQLEGTIKHQDRCSVNISAAGMEAAKEIDTYFKAKGSKIPCQYGVFDFSKDGTANKPVDFICTRPTQGVACTQYYSAQYGNLPLKLVNCVVPVAETKDYITLKNRVKSVVGLLKQGSYNNLHPHDTPLIVDQKTKVVDGKEKIVPMLSGSEKKSKSVEVSKDQGVVKDKGLIALPFQCENWLNIRGPDPLVVDAEKCVVERVEKDSNQNFGFGPPSRKAGFDYDLQNVNPIDGASTPVLHLVPRSTMDKGTLGKILKDESMTTVTPESKLKDILESGGTPPKPEPGDKLPAGKKEMVTSPMAAQAKISGVEIAGAQTETKPMSGTLPTGSGPETGISGGQTSTPFSLTLLPDITSTDQAKVAGMPVAWGGTLTVNANQAASRNKNNSGLCEFQIEYSVRNIGKPPTGSFRSLWTNSAVTGNWTRVWSPIAAGGVKSEKDLVPLKPGTNVLQLVLDDLHQVQESNEANNMFSLTINVTGSCGAGMGITPPTGTPLRR